jgi:hypothetical protein
MPRYKLIVLSSPVAGREADFDLWYQNIHLPEMMTISGFQSAQRFRLTESLAEKDGFPFLTIYEIETNDVPALLDEVRKRAGNGRLTISDSLSPQVYAVAYEPVGPAVTAAAGGS